ncbi:MAG: FixH family protein [Trueperaceae bacterium]
MSRRLSGSGRTPATSASRTTFLTPLLLVALLLVACEPPADRAATQGDGSVVISAELEAPAAIGPAPLVVRLTDPEGNGVEGATVRVEGDMTHAGMQPVITTADAVGNGLYRAEAMHFTMAGDWVITIVVTADGKRSSGVLLVNVPGR